jgi:phosphopantothenate---cysteine ligase (ATP)
MAPDPDELRSEDQYFSTNPASKELEAHSELARRFIEQHASAKRRVVLVTSGGTTVPLEKQTVRCTGFPLMLTSSVPEG